MTNRKLLSAFLLTTLTLLSISFYQSAFTKEDGAPSGNTNSPGDGKTCARDSCHTGEAKPISGLLSADVPAAGYNSTDTVTFTLTIDFPGRSTFGFQVSPQTLEGDKIGKLIATDDIQTKTTSVGKFITHEKQGIDGSDGKTWTFDWAPLEATGDVTFYYAVNAADGDEEPTGDSIYYGSFTISEDPANIPLAISEIMNTGGFTILNPVKETLYITPVDLSANYSIEIFDATGNLMLRTERNYAGTAAIPAGFLANGVYFIKFFNGLQYYSARFVKG